jgi:hypothetical protein
MEHVSFCPYRVNINYNWSSVQQTEHTAPVIFTGKPRDVDIAEVCKEVEEGSKPVDAPGMVNSSSIHADQC